MTDSSGKNHEQYMKRKEYFKQYRANAYQTRREAKAQLHAMQLVEAIEGKSQLEQVRIVQQYIFENFKYRVEG